MIFSKVSFKGEKIGIILLGFDWDGVKEMQAPIIPQQKQEIDPKTLLKIQSIFLEEKSPKGKDRNKQCEIPDFDMKRLDLLHELNQQTYHSFR